ncbi:acyltransferase ChoActase/COT/CPT [Aspergillus aurantiobrunneus]
MRNGHMYKVPLSIDGKPATIEQLTGAFNQVIHMADSKRASRVGVLTNDDRSVWSRNRDTLHRLSHDNASSLRDIESADFVVCLDRAKPQTADERVSCLWSATESNRWHDKPLQFVVFDNGVSGLIGEHSMIDGIVTRHLDTHVIHAIQEPPPRQPGAASSFPDSTPVLIGTNDELEAHIDLIPKALCTRLQNLRVKILDLDQFGTQLSRKHGLSPNAFVNMVVQLAFYKLYNKPVPTVEAVTTSNYFQGRLDFCRVVTDEVVAFCQAMAQQPRDARECQTLFQRAVRKHVGQIAAVAGGGGVDMHFLALKDMARETQEAPSLSQTQCLSIAATAW